MEQRSFLDLDSFAHHGDHTGFSTTPSSSAIPSRVPGASGFDVTPLGGPFNNPELLNWVNTFAGGTAFPAVGAGGYASLGTNNTVDEPHHNFGYSLGVAKTSARTR